MTQEEKQLLLKDLCARLPYFIEAQVSNIIEGESKPFVVNKELTFTDVEAFVDCDVVCDIKPYLRPMSSMTKEELHEVQEILGKGVEIREDFILSIDSSINSFTYLELQAVFDWLNAHHFDYRGLIEKGLAIAVTEENNPYKV